MNRVEFLATLDVEEVLRKAKVEWKEMVAMGKETWEKKLLDYHQVELTEGD